MKEIALRLEAVCALSIFAGIVAALIPQGKLKGAFSSFCAVVLVFSFVEPLSEIKDEGLGSSVAENARAEKELLSDVDTAEEQLYESLLAKGLEENLNSLGCKAEVKAECEKKNGEYKVVALTVKGELTPKEKSAAEKYLEDAFPGVEIKFGEKSYG